MAGKGRSSLANSTNISAYSVITGSALRSCWWAELVLTDVAPKAGPAADRERVTEDCCDADHLGPAQEPLSEPLPDRIDDDAA